MADTVVKNPSLLDGSALWWGREAWVRSSICSPQESSWPLSPLVALHLENSSWLPQIQLKVQWINLLGCDKTSCLATSRAGALSVSPWAPDPQLSHSDLIPGTCHWQDPRCLAEPGSLTARCFLLMALHPQKNSSLWNRKSLLLLAVFPSAHPPQTPLHLLSWFWVKSAFLYDKTWVFHN